MSNGDPQDLPIGAALRDARRRMGLDVKQAEERTKIRARYVRALENEDWDVLPGPVYIRGFLRTYGRILGLDGDALADRFRREHEEPAQPLASGSAESVLQHRRRLPDRGPSPLRPLVALAVVIGLVLLAFGLFGGDDESGGEPTNQAERSDGGGSGGGKANKKGNGKKGSGSGKQNSGPVKLKKENLKLKAITDVGNVCLAGTGKRALIDSQRLRGGIVERYSGNKRYRVDVERGSIEIRVADRTRRIDATDPVTYEADSRGIREVNYRGPDCP